MVRMHEWRGTKSNNYRSMQGAVVQVFPESHHRLCLWHIMKKISKKLSRLDQYKVIKKTLKTLVYESTNTQEFEDGWCKLVDKYGLEKNEWLCSLLNDRSHWVLMYVKVNFWAGMSTTQQSESINAFFDAYVNSKTSLRQFVEQYDNALKSKIKKENKADFESLNSSYKLVTGFYFERQFQEAYRNAIFKLFQDELRGMMQSHLIYNVLVICLSFAELFIGMVKILIEKDVKEIHPRYILSRWRKDVKHGHYSVINCYEDLMSGENAKQFDHLCSNFYEVAHIANSHEKYEYLLSCINMAKEKLNDDSFWGCSSNVKLIVEDFLITAFIYVLEKTDNIQQDPMGPSREHGAISYNDEPNYHFDLNVPV
ncbi:protein FAR1-RELATED SEQUENCE 6-like [Lactuca sativa]|uniref:protein FAR1-RELATED SEQUENCE 6-like n=1 Tax=Lactuca sativa TaxID=4236 RepID=UPI0022B02FFF|nr:protein FAR1-RELATED SEQUENCE 6-like [Lactuca sativa]